MTITSQPSRKRLQVVRHIGFRTADLNPHPGLGQDRSLGADNFLGNSPS